MAIDHATPRANGTRNMAIATMFVRGIRSLAEPSIEIVFIDNSLLSV
jgi:hypothetical protein